LHGTINVVAANDLGIVVLTDSMLTEIQQDANGVRTSRQVPAPGQKLFRIDDRTVCAFAGFASADTAPVPTFLNSVSAIVGRYQDRLRRTGPLSVSDKLELLKGVFTHYLTGIANIRGGTDGGDYSFELLVAGYDPDGTPEIGRLVLGTVLEPTTAGPLLRTVTRELAVFQVSHRGMIFVNGKRDLAMEILHNPSRWRADPAVAAYEQSTRGEGLLSIEQMKALAISLKQHTADRDPEVGGPNQIAVLANGSVQSIQQPALPPIEFSGYSFAIISAVRFGPSGGQGRPTGGAIVAPRLFQLYFRDEFIHVLQEIDNSYYGGSVFRDCILTYSGGKVQFPASNQIIDSDLEIATGVSRDSPEVKQLLHDFKWRTVKYQGTDQVGAK
jgi:20S proteasome alpha/beta subunit